MLQEAPGEGEMVRAGQWGPGEGEVVRAGQWGS